MTRSFDVRVQDDALCLGPVRVTFQRTLRLPETGLHHLPPGLGRFPVRRVEDYPDSAPAEWLQRGGVMLPIYQREAMWLSFHSDESAALQVGAGMVCAVSGEPWTEQLSHEPQNYCTLPSQPWLDGINAGAGFVRQFVAVPLGLGASIEAQVTGQEQHGDLQLRAVGLNDATLAREAREMQLARPADADSVLVDACALPVEMAADMGLSAGGQMRQEIYEDRRPVSDYEGGPATSAFVHLCSAEQWTTITGEAAPPLLIDRETYVKRGLPWFDYYDADATDLAASELLAAVDTVGTILGEEEPPHTSVDPASIVQLTPVNGTTVSDGTW